MFRDVVGALALLLFASALTLACTSKNKEACADNMDCLNGQMCSGSGVCVAEEIPDANSNEVVCPEATHQCTPSAPSGWIGPAIHFSYDAAGDEPSCPDDYSEGVAVVASHGLVAEGICACSCTVASDLTCSNAKIEGRDDGAGTVGCNVQDCLGCPTTTLPQSTCESVSITGENVYKYSRGSVTAATCVAGTTTNELTAEFTNKETVCTASNVLEGCDAGDTCTAKPDTEQDAMCIYQAGDHDCPAETVYTEKTLAFGSLNDERSCAATCDCDLPIGTKCGSINVSTDSVSCAGTLLVSATGGCQDNPAQNQSQGATYRVVPSEHSCDAVGDGEVLGTASGADPVTICCEA